MTRRSKIYFRCMVCVCSCRMCTVVGVERAARSTVRCVR